MKREDWWASRDPNEVRAYYQTEIKAFRTALMKISGGTFKGKSMDGMDVNKRLSRRDMRRIARLALTEGGTCEEDSA